MVVTYADGTCLDYTTCSILRISCDVCTSSVEFFLYVCITAYMCKHHRKGVLCTIDNSHTTNNMYRRLYRKYVVGLYLPKHDEIYYIYTWLHLYRVCMAFYVHGTPFHTVYV